MWWHRLTDDHRWNVHEWIHSIVKIDIHIQRIVKVSSILVSPIYYYARCKRVDKQKFARKRDRSAKVRVIESSKSMGRTWIHSNRTRLILRKATWKQSNFILSKKSTDKIFPSYSRIRSNYILILILIKT